MPIPIWLFKQGLKLGLKKLEQKGVTKMIPPLDEELKLKSLNEGEDEFMNEFRNPNSPMHKDVSEWTEWDRYRAENSPSYKHNYYLQQQVDQYNKNIVEKHLKDWHERDKLKKRW